MVADLSTQHQPVSDLFPRPPAADWNKYRLTDEQVEFFHENGYLAGVRILTDEQVDTSAGRAAMSCSIRAPGQRAVLRISHSNESVPIPAASCFTPWAPGGSRRAFTTSCGTRAFTVPASQLLGGGVRFWHDQLFCKPAHHGGVVAWHQDYSYWTRTKPMAHLTCWIGLDDATRDNGCLQYIPGSHRWQLLPVTGLAGDMNAIQTVLSPEQHEQFQPVAIELKKGECAFHHPLMVHGSYENRTSGPRRATVINVFRDGVHSASNEPLLEGVPSVPTGQKMDGQFFPLLYTPATA